MIPSFRDLYLYKELIYILTDFYHKYWFWFLILYTLTYLLTDRLVNIIEINTSFGKLVSKYISTGISTIVTWLQCFYDLSVVKEGKWKCWFWFSFERSVLTYTYYRNQYFIYTFFNLNLVSISIWDCIPIKYSWFFSSSGLPDVLFIVDENCLKGNMSESNNIKFEVHQNKILKDPWLQSTFRMFSKETLKIKNCLKFMKTVVWM